MFQIMSNNKVVLHRWIEFSDGTCNFQILDPSSVGETVFVTLLPEYNFKDCLFKILLIADAFKYLPNHRRISLNLPYLPNARADREFEKGMPVPLTVFFTAVSEWFDNIVVYDPHSFIPDSRKAMITIIPQSQCFMESVQKEDRAGHILVAPDKGAEEKIVEVAKATGLCEYVIASKERDVSTGKIKGVTLPFYNYEGKDFFIVDDICDGGGTFIPLAEQLKERGARSVKLYVTHGIFCKGLNIFKSSIDRIYCHHTVGKYVTKSDIMNFNLEQENKQ